MLQLFLTFCHLEAKAFITVAVVAPFCFSFFLLPHWSHSFVEKKEKLEKNPWEWNFFRGLLSMSLIWTCKAFTSSSSQYFISVASFCFIIFIFLDLFIYSLFYHLWFLYSNSKTSFRQKRGIFTCPHSWLYEMEPEHQRFRISCSSSEFRSASKNEFSGYEPMVYQEEWFG